MKKHTIEKKSKKKTVSIIIPTYNRENYILDCIHSVLNQKCDAELEIIIVDDGSTDNTLEKLNSFKDKIVLSKKSSDSNEQGASYARNRGISLATGDYITFLDSDDYYLPGHINRMLEEFESNQNFGYLFCRSKKEIFRDNSTKIVIDWTRKRLTELDKKYHVLSRAYCINTNVIFIKSEILKEIGFFNTQLSNGEDTEMWMKISEKYEGKFIDHYGAVYRSGHEYDQLTNIEISKKRKCAKIIYTNAFSRNFIKKEKDPIRLILIVRGLLHGLLPEPKNKLQTYINQLYVHLILFLLSPITFVKYIKMKLQ